MFGSRPARTTAAGEVVIQPEALAAHLEGMAPGQITIADGYLSAFDDGSEKEER